MMNHPHQDAIAEVIYAILKLPKHLKEAFSRGNPFDKLLRSYSEFTSSGLPLYKKNWGFNHYPVSIKALAQFKKTNTIKGLHAEHVTPLSLIKTELLEGKQKSLISLKRYLKKHNKVVIVTKYEQRVIDNMFRSKMPPNGQSRLEYFGIKIATSTKNNSLKSKK